MTNDFNKMINLAQSEKRLERDVDKLKYLRVALAIDEIKPFCLISEDLDLETAIKLEDEDIQLLNNLIVNHEDSFYISPLTVGYLYAIGVYRKLESHSYEDYGLDCLCSDILNNVIEQFQNELKRRVKKDGQEQIN